MTIINPCSLLYIKHHDCFSSLAFSAHSLPRLMCLKKKETKGVCVCSWVWSLTCFGGEYSKYQVMYNFIGEKKKANLPVEPEIAWYQLDLYFSTL